MCHWVTLEFFMQQIQSYLAIGAISILALASFHFNRNVLENSATEIENKVYLTAFSLADDLIEEIKEKAYDEKTIDFQAIGVNQLTQIASFGTDAGESWPNFDDIDDYKGYSKTISLPHVEGYNVSCDVSYVNSNGDVQSVQTYFKKVTVSVSSNYLRQPLQLSFIFSLHSKN